MSDPRHFFGKIKDGPLQTFLLDLVPAILILRGHMIHCRVLAGCGEPASLNLWVLGSGRLGLYKVVSEIPQGLQVLAFIEF